MPPKAAPAAYTQSGYEPATPIAWDHVEQNKYGRVGQQAQVAGGQNSLSCRAILGLILTKTIYLLQDTEKTGLYVQLIQETLAALLDIYNVRGNNEFSELIHLCLFAFDKVCDFYREQLFDEALI